MFLFVIIKLESGRKWEMLFFGTYYHNLDNKGRLVVPARFRQTLEATKALYLMQGFDGAISVYTEESFQKEMTFLEALNFKDNDSRKYARLVYSSIEELAFDNVGRLNLGNKVLTKYQIGTSVVVIGVGDHLEIWDSAAFEKYESGVKEGFETIAQNLVGVHHE